MNQASTLSATRASAKARAHMVFDRNQSIINRILSGEKRYVLAEEYGLTKNSISVITRKAGLPAYSRFKKTT